ncbi:MAG: hydroxymethylglutaryl-CoA lyase [Bacteroidetes bacterium]|nr:MAG: hydroxymethylglutaryl-CoA lyase [Bacteroidota bacterium]
MDTDTLQLVECPRDAMQGLSLQIPTRQKIAYLSKLLRIGFHTLDFGSFVSPKAVPQMADTAQVLAGLDLTETDTELLAIVANVRGAREACTFPEISYLGYPFSVSETFQLRNTRRTIAESVPVVAELQEMAETHGKTLVVYLSMGFGNPYGDPWSPDIVAEWTDSMAGMGVSILSLADTVGTAEPEDIQRLFAELIPRYPEIRFGAHFHAAPQARVAKLEAAWAAGCRRFDTTLQGYGGCPFAKDELVGNIATETLLAFLAEQGAGPTLNTAALRAASRLATGIFA